MKPGWGHTTEVEGSWISRAMDCHISSQNWFKRIIVKGEFIKLIEHK